MTALRYPIHPRTIQLRQDHCGDSTARSAAADAEKFSASPDLRRDLYPALESAPLYRVAHDNITLVDGKRVLWARIEPGTSLSPDEAIARCIELRSAHPDAIVVCEQPV
jgi:hypothetical protein